ncbi:hypothetical protein Emag_007478 [Eimeria magna]
MQESFFERQEGSPLSPHHPPSKPQTPNSDSPKSSTLTQVAVHEMGLAAAAAAAAPAAAAPAAAAANAAAGEGAFWCLFVLFAGRT